MYNSQTPALAQPRAGGAELAYPRQESRGINELLRSTCSPTVVVVDMQKAFCSPEGQTVKNYLLDIREVQKMIPRLKRFIDQARDHGLNIAWVRAPVKDQDHNPNFDYYKVQPKPGDLEVVKTETHDGMHLLNRHLRRGRVQTVVVIGVFESLCVKTEVFVANYLGYYSIVPSDLVADAPSKRSPYSAWNIAATPDWRALDNTHSTTSTILLEALK